MSRAGVGRTWWAKGDRVGQVWWSRVNGDITKDHEPCVVLQRWTTVASLAWILRPLERIWDARSEFIHFESQFAYVEAGGDDAWVGKRIA